MIVLKFVWPYGLSVKKKKKLLLPSLRPGRVPTSYLYFSARLYITTMAASLPQVSDELYQEMGHEVTARTDQKGLPWDLAFLRDLRDDLLKQLDLTKYAKGENCCCLVAWKMNQLHIIPCFYPANLPELLLISKWAT